jgi:hypothetical protein
MISADQVLWIGDSWIDVPGAQRTTVRDLARAAGTIGPNEDYTDMSAAGALMSQIASQYSSAEATSIKVKVLLMDGGGFDLILANGSAATVASVVSTFTQLLSTVASDGTVQQIVYFLVPELPSVPGVAALRPGMEQACSASAVPCYFLDLQTLWSGHPEYTASGNVFASDAGAVALGQAIWALMQDHCVAQ